MSTPEEQGGKGFKTLGIKLKNDAHAQLSFIAQLRGGTITDEILIAITQHLTRAKDDPELVSKADALRAEMEREAAMRQAAIGALFAATEPVGSGDGNARPRSTRRGQQSEGSSPES